MYFIEPSTDKFGPLLVTVYLNEMEAEMEVDTGAAVSVISEDTYVKLWLVQRPQL